VYYGEQSLKNYSRAAGLKFQNFLQHKIECRVHNSPSSDPALSRLNPVQVLTSYLSILILSFNLRSGLGTVFLFRVSRLKFLIHSHPVHVIHLAQLMPLNLFVLKYLVKPWEGRNVYNSINFSYNIVLLSQRSASIPWSLETKQPTNYPIVLPFCSIVYGSVVDILHQNPPSHVVQYKTDYFCHVCICLRYKN
jgi:hypothetical protein